MCVVAAGGACCALFSLSSRVCVCVAVCSVEGCQGTSQGRMRSRRSSTCKAKMGVVTRRILQKEGDGVKRCGEGGSDARRGMDCREVLHVAC